MIRVTRSAVIDAPIETVWRVLRDFNSHTAWHPMVRESVIENGEPSDQVGCVRNFVLRDGNHVREQLLTLSDKDFTSTYCILDATLPMRHYVASVQLRPVTDGNRTFWHWQSAFEVPPGREQEFESLVGHGVYEGGFEGLRAFLRRGGSEASRASRAQPSNHSATTGGRLSTVAQSTQAIIANRHGGPDVLQLRTVEVPSPGPGEVTIRQNAIGVNYIDVYVRQGLYPLITPPACLGVEAAGVVYAVGEGVAHVLPGDRVAYACLPPGAYAALRTMNAEHVVVVPDHISDEQAAGIMLKGMTAEILLHRVCRVQRGDWILVHAAAGGVGQVLCQWAKRIGARVIGTVSTESKARIARERGCEFTLIAPEYRFASAVKEITKGVGAQYIYDGNGRASLRESVDALAMCGHLVSYGAASGAVENVDMVALSAKSATLSRPVLFHYTANRQKLVEIAQRVFAAVAEGTLSVDVRHRYSLAAAAEAHRDLEARRTTGSIVLLP